MAEPAPVCGILLAAGRGSRFGGEKLLAPLFREPLAVHAARVLAGARQAGILAEAFAVVRERGELASLLEQAGLVVVVAPDADRGMSRSLAAGLAAVEERFPAGPAAAIVALADQPDTPIEAISRIAAVWQTHGDAVVRPRYRATPDEPGHPVLLDRATWALARGLEGDTGLAPALRDAEVAVTYIDVPGRNAGINTQADLAARLTTQEID